jgi:hypothetical protein
VGLAFYDGNGAGLCGGGFVVEYPNSTFYGIGAIIVGAAAWRKGEKLLFEPFHVGIIFFGCV